MISGMQNEPVWKMDPPTAAYLRVSHPLRLCLRSVDRDLCVVEYLNVKHRHLNFFIQVGKEEKNYDNVRGS
jgi:hypothetical protein